MNSAVRLIPPLLLIVSACQPPPPANVGDAAAEAGRMAALEARLATLETVASRNSHTISTSETAARESRADHSVLIEDLRVEINSLKGSLEILQFEIKEQERAGRKFQEDVDLRLRDLEPTRPAPAAVATPGDIPRASGVRDITRYNQILSTMRDRKDYSAAIEQFRGFISDYPQSALTDNAQYWIGEGFFAKGEFPAAIAEFQKVIDAYPSSPKVCDALLKQGFAFAAMTENEKARLFLTDVTKRCPGTATSTKATARLNTLNTATPAPSN